MTVGFLKSKFVLALSVIGLFFILYSLGQQLYKRYQILSEIARMRAEIASYQTKNDEMLKLINYFKTPEYQERQARSLLNLQKPGEFAVALPPSLAQEPAATGQTAGQKKSSNLQQWWDYFFGAK